MASTSTDPAAKRDSGVCFPEGTSGSRLFSRLLTEAAAAFPGAFGALRIPSGDGFRKGYGELASRFESMRAASGQRAAISLFLARRQLESFAFQGESDQRPLLEALAQVVEPLPISVGQGAQEPQAVLEVPYRGHSYRGPELAKLGQELLGRHGATRAAVRALEWLSEQGGPDGRLDLSGRSFAVLGASAEIGPSELLLRAGARVLWIDKQEPPAVLRRERLSWIEGGADLLAQPHRIARTLEQFAGGQPLHVAAFAYAPGRGREWRLAVAMNAITHRLAPDQVASLALLLSPTSPAIVQPEDLEAARTRSASAALWQKALGRTGLLGAPHIRSGEVSVVRSVVPVQGPTYQAAQYLAKRLSAEAFAVYGAALDSARPQPMLVSANVAPITKTRSLNHPLFEAGFLGAPLFGVEIFPAETTRALGALLLLHDLLNPASPAAALVKAGPLAAQSSSSIFAEQIHGGTFGLPWALEPSIGAAAVIGLGQRPSLLLKLLR